MRWKCVCSYDGSQYCGWQIQDGEVSVQQILNEKLGEILKADVRVAGSGRTDTGVHAIGQVFHVDCDWKHGALRMQKALDSLLPSDIQITSIEPASDDFHARFSAKSKRYEYRIFLGQADPFIWNYCWSLPGALDLNKVKSGMELLEGKHDFAAFAANRGKEYESTVRTMMNTKLTVADAMIRLSFEADGFLYKMVRSLVGTLVGLGQGRLEVGDIAKLLQTAERTPFVVVAPARGLFLEKVFY